MPNKKTIIAPMLDVPLGKVQTGVFSIQFNDEDPIEICAMYDGGIVQLELGESGCIEFQSGDGKTFRLKLVKEI